MISTRKLIKMARKWQGGASIRRKRISFPDNNNGNANSSGTSCSLPVAEKGHFVVYTADRKRYSLPLTYLNNYIFRELFRMAEEEFGLPSDRPIALPCDSTFMDCIISLIQRHATKDAEKALFFSVAAACRHSSFYNGHQSESRQHHELSCF